MKTLQVRIPDQLRLDVDSILIDIGLDLPTAVRLYLNKIVQTRSIPFSLEATNLKLEDVVVDAEIQGLMENVAKSWKPRRK